MKSILDLLLSADLFVSVSQSSNIWSRIEQYKPVFVEPRNKYEFNTAMTNFYSKINDPALNGAIFAAVCRGKVSCYYRS